MTNFHGAFFSEVKRRSLFGVHGLGISGRSLTLLAYISDEKLMLLSCGFVFSAEGFK